MPHQQSNSIQGGQEVPVHCIKANNAMQQYWQVSPHGFEHLTHQYLLQCAKSSQMPHMQGAACVRKTLLQSVAWNDPGLQ